MSVRHEPWGDMSPDEVEARRSIAGGSKRWAVTFAALGLVVAVLPFVAGAHAMWILLGVGLGIVCLGVAFTVASDATPDGPPPRRTG